MIRDDDGPRPINYVASHATGQKPLLLSRDGTDHASGEGDSNYMWQMYGVLFGTRGMGQLGDHEQANGQAFYNSEHDGLGTPLDDDGTCRAVDTPHTTTASHNPRCDFCWRRREESCSVCNRDCCYKHHSGDQHHDIYCPICDPTKESTPDGGEDGEWLQDPTH